MKQRQSQEPETVHYEEQPPHEETVSSSSMVGMTLTEHQLRLHSMNVSQLSFDVSCSSFWSDDDEEEETEEDIQKRLARRQAMMEAGGLDGMLLLESTTQNAAAPKIPCKQESLGSIDLPSVTTAEEQQEGNFYEDTEHDEDEASPSRSCFLQLDEQSLAQATFAEDCHKQRRNKSTKETTKDSETPSSPPMTVMNAIAATAAAAARPSLLPTSTPRRATAALTLYHPTERELQEANDDDDEETIALSLDEILTWAVHESDAGPEEPFRRSAAARLQSSSSTSLALLEDQPPRMATRRGSVVATTSKR